MITFKLQEQKNIIFNFNNNNIQTSGVGTDNRPSTPTIIIKSGSQTELYSHDHMLTNVLRSGSFKDKNYNNNYVVPGSHDGRPKSLPPPLNITRTGSQKRKPF